MTGSERDDEFETYLRRRVRIDRRLRSLDRLEPPAELDRIIIGYARHAIQDPAPAPVFRGAGLPTPRWALPMGMAATILLSLSILLDLGMKGAMLKDAGGMSRAAGATAPEELVMDMPKPESAPGPAPATQAAAAFSRPPARPPVRTAPLAVLHRAVAPAAAASVQGTASSNTARVASDGSSVASSGRRNTLGAVGSGSAEPIQATSPVADRMEIVTVFGTRLVQRDIFPMPGLPAATAMGAGPAPYVPDLSYILGENSLDWAAERQQHPNPREWLAHIKKMQAAGLRVEADQELRRLYDAYPAFQAIQAPAATAATDGGPQ